MYKTLEERVKAANEYMEALGYATRDIMGNKIDPTKRAAPLTVGKPGVEASFECTGKRWNHIAPCTGDSFLAGNDINREKVFEVEPDFDEHYESIVRAGLKICPSVAKN